jgi:ubiquinone/menaquinone biosynthesis C-methylase UbiE
MTDKDNLYFLEDQYIELHDFDAEGLILDVGGGGEGVIGELKKDQVIAIDKNRQELEEAPDGPLKIVMDATDLHFLDQSFLTVTVFFSMMFIPMNDHQKILSEITRVLKPGGRFLLWDISVIEPFNLSKSHFAFHLKVKLTHTTIMTGYGHPWPEKTQDMDYYKDLIEKSGFNLINEKSSGLTFFCEFAKLTD